MQILCSNFGPIRPLKLSKVLLRILCFQFSPEELAATVEKGTLNVTFTSQVFLLQVLVPIILQHLIMSVMPPRVFYKIFSSHFLVGFTRMVPML